jgi:hypothetical protein
VLLDLPFLRGTSDLVASGGPYFREGVFMAMDDFRLLAAVGVFHVPKGATAPVCFPDGEDPIDLLTGLESMEGRQVELVAHYLPDSAAPDLRGLGSCLMGEHCPTGHMENPDWILQYHEKGLLRKEGFAWFVNDARVPLGQLPGHRARFFMTTTEDVKVEGIPTGEADPFPDEEIQDILKDAQELADILKGLQAIVREGE